MSFVDVDRPYSIPMSYLLYRDNLCFILSREGRKTRCLERSRNVCYVVVSKDYSIVIEGSLEKVTNKEEIREVNLRFVES